MDADVQTPTISQFLRSYSFRVCVYAVVALLVFYATFLAIGVHGADAMGAENGPIETAQVVLAVLGAVGLFCAALWTRIGRAGLVIAGAVVAYAAARESDQTFEALMFDDAYKWVVGLPMSVLAVVADARRPSLLDWRNDVADASTGCNTVRCGGRLSVFRLPIS